MKPSLAPFALILALFIVSPVFAQANQPQESYPPNPDSQEQPGAPKGEPSRGDPDPLTSPVPLPGESRRIRPGTAG